MAIGSRLNDTISKYLARISIETSLNRIDTKCLVQTRVCILIKREWDFHLDCKGVALGSNVDGG